jgi:tetratricopeptide (TPR) repeat protein
MYTLRNDPRSLDLLTRIESLRARGSVDAERGALLDQTWGEYWRRAGDIARAIEHKHRALNAFERLGDTRQILSTYNNLSLLYSEAKDHARSIDYAMRVLRLADQVPVDDYVTTSAKLNLGVAHFWLDDFDTAIHWYELSLSSSVAAGLPVNANRARYNLAEAHYQRFRLQGAPEDEAAGDAYASQVLAAPSAERDSWTWEAAPRLKREVLGGAGGHVHERFWPEELAAHFDDLSEVRTHRATLVLPISPEEHLQARLAIARAYLRISTREREAAAAFALERGIDITNELDSLHRLYAKDVTRERNLLDIWCRSAQDIVSEERIRALLEWMQRSGSINKSAYAQLLDVALATASKHLGSLAERGLLVQTGKGPSTRYLLPDG